MAMRRAPLAAAFAAGQERSLAGPTSNQFRLAIKDLHFSYANGTKAVDGVSLEFRKGVTAIVGPSGCGKSTLLRLIAGLSTPTEGTIERRFAPGRHDLAMVFQEETLLPFRTVRNNVAIYDKLHKTSKAEAIRHVEDLLSLVGLKEFADVYPSQLSGGMRRRVAFLSAIASTPQILLLDEPFSSVDEPTRIGIHQDVLRIVREYDIATVLVTHDIAEAISLSDRIVLLTHRPSQIAQIFEAPFDGHREMLKLRESHEFLELYGQVWAALASQISAGAE